MSARVRRAPSLHRSLTALAIGAAILAGCQVDGGGGNSTPGNGGNGGSGPGAEANVITGRVTTEGGAPVASAAVRIVGYTGGNNLGQEIETVLADGNGVYRYDVPRGLYEVLAQGALDWHGQTYLFDLDPADGSCEQQPSEAGIVKDFVLRLTGLTMCYEGVDPLNSGWYHGAAIQLGNGTSAAPDAVVEYSLTPANGFADGSAGRTITLQRTIEAHSTSARLPLEQTWVLHDVPLADYTVTAELLSGGGRQPLLLTSDSTTTPAPSVEISFDARSNVSGEPVVGYSTPSIRIHDGS